jgi:hypothetical protein
MLLLFAPLDCPSFLAHILMAIPPKANAKSPIDKSIDVILNNLLQSY